jgi:hypothetical protein
MTSIPKTHLRGNGRDPKPAPPGSFYRPPRAGAAESSDNSAWDAITYVEQIRNLLDTYFGFDYFGADAIGYSLALDLEYQSLVSSAVSLLDASPCFKGMWWPDRIAPYCLGHADRRRWLGHYDGNPGRDELIAFQSEMAAALFAAGIARSATGDQGRPEAALVSDAATGITGQLNQPVIPSDTKETVAPRPAKKTGRRPLAISAELISRTYWEMVDEPDPFDTARKRKYSPSQQDVADRLKSEGLGGNPKSMREILTRVGMGWPPPTPASDD